MSRTLKAVLAISLAAVLGRCEVADKGHHHHHHHHKHQEEKVAQEKAAVPTAPPTTNVAPQHTVHKEVAVVRHAPEDGQANLVEKVHKLEGELADKEESFKNLPQGKLKVNGPLPDDFSERFEEAAAEAASCLATEIHVLESKPLDDKAKVVEIVFEAPKDIVNNIEDQGSDANSKFTRGAMHEFLVQPEQQRRTVTAFTAVHNQLKTRARGPEDEEALTPVADKGIDVDTSMPYGELEAFGREDTAQELTESSIKESDEMVDQLERAEVAEEKRAVFRALTRLRGAAITSFDGVARSQTGNIDEYNKVHKWRNTHPLAHLADEESDVSKWAFPDSADF